MQRIAGGLNHFGIVEVADTQTDRHLETKRPALDLKRDANLLAAWGCLDACHFDPEFAHRFTFSYLREQNSPSGMMGSYSS